MQHKAIFVTLVLLATSLSAAVGKQIRLNENSPLLSLLSEDTTSALVPLLEDLFGWASNKIRALFEAQGLAVQEWEKIRTDAISLFQNGNNASGRGELAQHFLAGREIAACAASKMFYI